MDGAEAAGATATNVVAAAAVAAQAAAPAGTRILTFEINRASPSCKTGWHYGWTSSRHMRTRQHLLKTYVMRVPLELCCRACTSPLMRSSGARSAELCCPHCGLDADSTSLFVDAARVAFAVVAIVESPGGG